MSQYELHAITLNIPQPQTDRFAGPDTKNPAADFDLLLYEIQDVSDLARVCRTSRLLHYMTVPQLYKNITLTAYHDIRYRDDVPEGFGSASPFSMGLNALVTRTVTNLVESLCLQGEWREYDLEECSRVGRVPDGSMILNIVVRAALDRCTDLKSFTWNLNTRLLPTAYTGLAKLKHLQSFHLRFPSSRTPQPATEIPAFPELRKFTMSNYDPLNSPDDVSNMFFHATKLETLNMHFSPRMRDAGEASVQFINFFRKNVAANKPIPVQRVGLYNIVATQSREMLSIIDPGRLEGVTIINSLGGGLGAEPGVRQNLTYWIDKTWDTTQRKANETHNSLKSVRDDRITKDVAQELATAPLLEKIYMINAKYLGPSNSSTPESSLFSAGPSPRGISNGTTPIGNLPRTTMTPGEMIRDNIINVLCSVQGTRLRHLILPAKIPLASHSMATLIRGCPNLSQLSCAVEEIIPETMRIILPFGKKLFAFRLTCPDQSGEEGLERKRQFQAFESREDHDYFLSLEMAGRFGGNPQDFGTVKYVGFGCKAWEIGGLYEETTTTTNDDGNEMQSLALRRRIRPLILKDVMDIEIWKMDTLDIV